MTILSQKSDNLLRWGGESVIAGHVHVTVSQVGITGHMITLR